jgi:hypothetical protein
VHTDGDKQRIIVYSGYRTLQIVDNDRRNDTLSGAGLSADGKYCILAFEEACQVRTDPKTGEFLAIVS